MSKRSRLGKRVDADRARLRAVPEALSNRGRAEQELERLLNLERPREGRADFRTDVDPELGELERQGYIRAERADEGDTCDYRRRGRRCGRVAVWRILDGCYCDPHGVQTAKRLDRTAPKMTVPRGKVKR